MTPDQIAKSYDQIADRWNGGDFDRTNGIEQHEKAIRFVKERRDAIDIGCGSSGRIIDHLIGHGFR
ncbi:MAG: class I SAM-dependent methyltransferase, partial [Woeseiaceae bacterium]